MSYGPRPPFDPDRVPDTFIRECEERGKFLRENELILQLTSVWSDQAIRTLIDTLKERHELE